MPASAEANGPHSIAFEEIQAFRQWWLLLPLAIAAIAAWSMFLTQVAFSQPVGTNPASDVVLWIVLAVAGILLPGLMLSVRMRTTVDADAITIRYRPFTTRRLRLAEIEHAAAVTYHPILDYGGWGLRWSLKGWCYSVSGNRGVLVTLRDGKQVMIGSRRAEELARAVATMHPTMPGVRSAA
jgi:hypothetical protein